MNASANHKSPDLTGIDPLRWAEVTRRIEAIEAYLALPFPTADDRAAAARSVGLGAPQFMNLVRAWQVSRRPDAIASTGGRTRTPRGPRSGGLPPATRAAAEEAIAALPVNASHREAIRAVAKLCAQRRTRPPSDGMVAYIRMSLLNRIVGGAGPSHLVIGRAIVAMPVRIDDRLILPELLIAVDLRDGAVRAAALALGDGPSPSFREELGRLDMTGIELLVETVEDREISMAVVAEDRDLRTRFSTGRMLAKTLGSGIGPVDLIYSPRTKLTPERILRAGADEPLSPADAAIVLQAALAEHDRRRGAGEPVLLML